MCHLHIYAQSYSRNVEVLPEAVENAELVVEDVVSHVLLELFGEAEVDNVSIRFFSDSQAGLKHCSIQIHAQCSCRSSTAPLHSIERMKLILKEGMSYPLKELFGSVNVDNIMLGPSLCEYWNNLTPSHSV